MHVKSTPPEKSAQQEPSPQQEQQAPQEQQATASLGGSGSQSTNAVMVGQAATSFDGSGCSLSANAFVIRPGMTKYGPRSGGKLEAAQYAIGVLYTGGPPKHLNLLKLARDVDAVLRSTQPEFVAAYGTGNKGLVIDPLTVRRALQKWHEANP
jgi:hypothetical protein